MFISKMSIITSGKNLICCVTYVAVNAPLMYTISWVFSFPLFHSRLFLRLQHTTVLFFFFLPFAICHLKPRICYCFVPIRLLLPLKTHETHVCLALLLLFLRATISNPQNFLKTHPRNCLKFASFYCPSSKFAFNPRNY